MTKKVCKLKGETWEYEETEEMQSIEKLQNHPRT